MSRRRDDEDRWLEARERGESAAPIPEQTAAKYAQLRSLLDDLPALPAGVRLRPGWQDSVLGAIDRGETELAPTEAVPQVRSIDTAPRVRRSRRVVLVASCVAAAAGIAIVVGLVTTSAADPELTIVAVATDRPKHRAPDVLMAGDKAIVRGVIDGPGELRAYGEDDAELARCNATSATAGCTVDRSDKRTTLQLELVLPAPGPLHLVLLAAPLRGPSNGRARDLADAERAGIAVTPLDKIVR